MYLLPQHFRRDERNAIIGDVKPLLVFQQIKSYLQSGRDDAALVHNNPSQANMPADIVQRLNTEHQEVIYLRFFLELSVAETAEILNIPEGTVKSRLNRALQQLRGVVLHEFPLLHEGRQV